MDCLENFLAFLLWVFVTYVFGRMRTVLSDAVWCNSWTDQLTDWNWAVRCIPTQRQHSFVPVPAPSDCHSIDNCCVSNQLLDYKSILLTSSWSMDSWWITGLFSTLVSTAFFADLYCNGTDTISLIHDIINTQLLQHDRPVKCYICLEHYLLKHNFCQTKSGHKVHITLKFVLPVFLQIPP